MSSVFMRLRSKRFFMRAAARLLFCVKLNFFDGLRAQTFCLRPPFDCHPLSAYTFLPRFAATRQFQIIPLSFASFSASVPLIFEVTSFNKIFSFIESFMLEIAAYPARNTPPATARARRTRCPTLPAPLCRYPAAYTPIPCPFSSNILW